MAAAMVEKAGAAAEEHASQNQKTERVPVVERFQPEDVRYERIPKAHEEPAKDAESQRHHHQDL
jgi:hypothetical protein